MNRERVHESKLSKLTITGESYAEPKSQQRYEQDARVTQGQLEALSVRLRDELERLFQRASTGTIVTIHDNILTIKEEHSLTAAEHNLMRRRSGREFFQHYLEELTEQMYPVFVEHIESILPFAVTYFNVKAVGEDDNIVFTFGLRPNRCWFTAMTEANSLREQNA